MLKLAKMCFLFYVPECFSRAMLRISEADKIQGEEKTEKNDELQIQHHQCNISLSRSLHIVVHNHW